MKRILAITVLSIVSGCANHPVADSPKSLAVSSTYTKDQVRRACWKGIKQACGVKGSCYEKAGNYCESEKIYQDIQGNAKK